MKKALVALLGICTVAACGGTDIENQHPIVTDFIPAFEIYQGERREFVVSDHFSDPDGDSLTYQATSSDPDNLRALLQGTLLTVEGLGAS